MIFFFIGQQIHVSVHSFTLLSLFTTTPKHYCETHFGGNYTMPQLNPALWLLNTSHLTGGKFELKRAPVGENERNSTPPELFPMDELVPQISFGAIHIKVFQTFISCGEIMPELLKCLFIFIIARNHRITLIP
jgi:hypothetical protein